MPLVFTLTSFLILFLFGRFLGRIVCIVVSIGLTALSLLLCLYQLYHVFFLGEVTVYTLGNWFITDTLQVPFKFLVDPLSISFATLISFITLLILIYSYDYLHNDPHLVIFFAYLNFFSFSMTCLVMAGNYLVMFLGWETVGLASYLLINFWSTRIQANQAALKAIIFNRLGDIAFLSAMALLNLVFHSLEFENIEFLITDLRYTSINLFHISFNAIELIAFFMFIAAVAKSAQLFLHPWLPDAMEGPTPVSALLHSATMVTAGVFLMLRSAIIFNNISYVSYLVAIIGLLTANMSSFTGLVQYDIKRIIAFSTCSQLGYMVFAVGIGSYSFAIFHLINHAFFKALLFLCAGSVIHATGEQDIRRMGTLVKSLPLTYSAMLLGSLSLVGFPFLSGFYSKDMLLEGTFGLFHNWSYIIYMISAISTFLSSFYSFRLIYLVFFGEVSLSKKALANVSEGSIFMYLPMITLSIFSIFSGFILKDYQVYFSTYDNFYQNPDMDSNFDTDFIQDLLKVLPSIFSLLGIAGVYAVFVLRPNIITTIYKQTLILTSGFNKKFLFDNVYNLFASSWFFQTAYLVTYNLLDRGLYESSGPTGLYSLIETQVNRLFIIETTTIIYRMLLVMILVAIALLSAILCGTLDIILILGVSLYIFVINEKTY